MSNNEKKAVIVSSSFAHLERIELLKEGYEKKGYSTKVLMTDFIHSSKTYNEEIRADYVYIRTIPYKKNISVQRLYSRHCFAKDALSELEKMEIDLLHVLIPANSLAKIAREYKERHPKIQMYLDIIDLWPETMPINRFKTAYPFRKWQKLRDDNLWNADLIYCECNLYKKVLNKEKDEKFKILYWSKKSEAIPSSPQLNTKELHLCYLGSINNIIDIDYIVKMCEELSKVKKIVIHIIGRGERQEELLSRLKETEANVIYHGVIYDQFAKQAIFDQCHFGLNIMKQSVCVGLTMKSLDYFQAGLPIINNIQGDTFELVKQYKIGYNYYEELVENLNNLHQEDYISMRQNVKSMYNEKFTKEAFFRALNV